MFNIVSETRKSVTTLNDIPVKQVFRGTIVFTRYTTPQKDFNTITGVFQKFHGANSVSKSKILPDAVRYNDVIVIILEGCPLGCSPLILDCHEVRDYEPLDATLILSKQ